jgi:hypothetical protein
MKNASFAIALAVALMMLSGCSENYPLHKADNNVYHIVAVPKAYDTGDPASAKCKAYVAPFMVRNNRHGKWEYLTINYTEFIKSALSRRFGRNVSFVNSKEGADIAIETKRVIYGYDLKSSDYLYMTASVNGVIVTAKGQAYHYKTDLPPTAEGLSAEIEPAADALISVLRETSDGKISVKPLHVYSDPDIHYLRMSDGLTVEEGPLGYNVEKLIEVN